MSVTSSMWTAVSGLLAHGEKMGVVGNNIANVNTMGYKSQRMDFEDFVYQDTSNANGFTQMGRGVAVNAIMGDFSQGSSERSNTVTDISINGNGFFKVRNPSAADESFFTRAGNVRFNNQGELVDPHGYIMQGWEIEKPGPSIASSSATTPNAKIKGSGVAKDIKLGTFTCQPQHTNSITVLDRLSKLEGEKSSSVNNTNPFFALLEKWDASNPETTPPLSENSFTHQTTMTVYDEGGAKHLLTVYFDRVDNDTLADDGDAAVDQWEYMVTMDPLTDKREFGAASDLPPTDKSRGVLMTGTLSFSNSGILQNMSAFVPDNKNYANPVNLNDPISWVPAPMSNSGKPMMLANFSGLDNMPSPWELNGAPSTTPDVINQEALPYMIEFDFGITSRSKGWDPSPYRNDYTAASVGGGKTPLTDPPQDPPVVDTPPDLIGMQNVLSDGNTTVAVADTSTTNYQQDGYGFGYMQNILISRDGILSVRYDNGETLDLYQIALYDFINQQGLYREGSNLYSSTRESGNPTEGGAGTTGLGQVYSNSLEMSNVDLAQEFVYMISTQRGFQGNSKTITTVDTMLEQIINMKR